MKCFLKHILMKIVAFVFIAFCCAFPSSHLQISEINFVALLRYSQAKVSLLSRILYFYRFHVRAQGLFVSKKFPTPAVIRTRPLLNFRFF